MTDEKKATYCKLSREEIQEIHELGDVCECCGGGTERGYRFCTPCQEICGRRA